LIEDDVGGDGDADGDDIDIDWLTSSNYSTEENKGADRYPVALENT